MDANMLREAIASLFSDTLDSVLLYDVEGNAVAANEATLILTGYLREEIVGTTYRAHVRNGDMPNVELAVRTALAGGTDHFDTTIRRKNGDLVPVEVDLFPARFGDEIIGFFAQAHDIGALRSAEESLTMNQERFRSLFEYHPDGIMELKETGAISRVNVALESQTGFYSEQVVGKQWVELVAPESRSKASEALRAAIRGEAVEHDALLLDRLGDRIDVQLKLVPLHFGNEIRGAYAIFKNVTAQKSAERAIAEQSERIRRLYLVAASRGESLDGQIDATLQLGLELFGWDQGYVCQFDDELLRVRSAVAAGDGIAKGAVYPLRGALPRNLRELRTQLYVPDMQSEPWRNDPAAATALWRSYFGIRLTVFAKVYGSLVFAGRAPRAEGIPQSEQDLVQLMGLFISAALERAEQNERIKEMAFNDPLTGLPNRLLFKDRIEQALATARRYNRGFAVMYLDLDKFKEINDRYGHSTGDLVLKSVAARFRSVLRESDTVARFGGDEFVILQPVVDGPSDAADLARKLSVATQEPITVDGHTVDARVSIGIALYPSDARSIEELMESADRALYAAKREGRNRWCFANADSARRDLRKS
jgi:diguanylate cyclase (GGDEF)-like protein/PAS domain S-box-containing protein